MKQRPQATVAISCYAMSSIALSITNKGIFSDAAFDFPFCVLATQAGSTVLLLLASSTLGVGEAVNLSHDLLRHMAPVTLLFVGMLWTSAQALRSASMPVVTIFKSLSVVSISLYEWHTYGEPIEMGAGASLVAMAAGSLLCSAGDLRFSAAGYTWLLLNVAFTVAHLATMRAWLKTGATTASKTFHNQLIALILFLAAAVTCGELAQFRERLAEQSPLFVAGLVASSVLSLAIARERGSNASHPVSKRCGFDPLRTGRTTRRSGASRSPQAPPTLLLELSTKFPPRCWGTSCSLRRLHELAGWGCSSGSLRASDMHVRGQGKRSRKAVD